ncbi:MAG: phospholipase D family protein [Sandaracinobacteroides sp.]
MSEVPTPFLRSSSRLEHGPLPFPVRRHNRVTPLLLSAAMYPELERLVLGARTTVYLAFRVFDPDTRTRSPEAGAAGLADWTALLKHAVERGVTVRLLLADFEPTVAHVLHGSSWQSFRTLAAMAAQLSEDARERFEMIVAQHPGEVGWATRQLLRLPIGFVIRRALKELADTQEPLDALVDVRPGLWRYHELKGGRARFRSGPAPRLWPATHHHKFAVVDSEFAIIGGIDVDERRWETRRYAQPADQTWHDVSVRLEGSAATDAAAHFRNLWNAELPRYIEITRHWMTDAQKALVIEPLDRIADEPGPLSTASTGSAQVQLLRTMSRRDRGLFAIGPRPDVRELLQGYRNVIFSARRLLYIEAQFFRYQRAARWIVEQARRAPELRIVILLPQAPDDVAFGGQRDNPAHRHGEYLQSRALGLLKSRLADRVGLFSLAKKQPLTEDERAFVRDRGAVFGSGMIYVHSKLALADDAVALVSSANINNRSFSWDSEFGLLWQDPEGVPALRSALWGQLLELPPDKALQMGLADWTEIANRNILTAPADRQGYVVPYQLARARRFGRPRWFLPDDLV